MDLITILLSTIFASALGILGLAYYQTKREEWWAKEIPCAKHIFPFGHIMQFLINIPYKNGPRGASVIMALKAMAKDYEDSGMFIIKLGWKNIVLLTCPEKAEVLLKSQTEIAKSMFYKPLKGVLGEGLITSCGDDKWKLHRKTINPVFHVKMLERFQEIMSNHSLTMVKKIQQKAIDGPVEIGPLVGPCTFDIIMESTTGKNIKCQMGNENDVLVSIERFMEIAAQRVFHPWYFPNFVFFNMALGKESWGHSSKTQNFFLNFVKERKEILMNNKGVEEDYDRPCLLDLLISQQDKKIATFSDEEIVHELENLAIPGFETVTAALGYAIHLIGNYPEVQKKIHQELDDIFGTDSEREITSQDYLKMKYMECVVKEILRLYPPVPIIARTLKEDCSFEGKIVGKGTDVVVFSPPIHMHKKHYEKPEEFMPERHFYENSKDRHPYAFVPFSSGPRNCIGGGFALRALRNILAAVLRSFEIKSTDNLTELHTNFATIGRPHKPVYVDVRNRHAVGA